MAANDQLRENARKALASAAKRTVTVHKDDGLHVNLILGDDQEQADRMAREAGEKAIKAGHAVTWDDGTKEWINVTPVWAEREDGGYELVFDEHGDRVKVARTRVRMMNGERHEELLGHSFRAYDKVFDD